MPSGPNSSKVNVRPGRSLTAYSIRSSLASNAGSKDSFHVFVRWKVIPRRASKHRRASRPIRTGLAMFPRLLSSDEEDFVVQTATTRPTGRPPAH
ncbi:hypothetical protein DWB77_07364 [Streptomyces hundungensis]|uniref:Uncharacterized protein n=1 Tax=Streptomyces hundungensis TaxID=1077946 RepID=A0A387HT37_9ACTN|nr:hypothetical protein DWB77_07364 [Streptomyces hundungensis]